MSPFDNRLIFVGSDDLIIFSSFLANGGTNHSRKGLRMSPFDNLIILIGSDDLIILTSFLAHEGTWSSPRRKGLHMSPSYNLVLEVI